MKALLSLGMFGQTTSPLPVVTGSGFFNAPAHSVRSVEERNGILLIIGFFFIIGGWLALAPLAAAVVTPGVVAVEGRRQTVQHLDGGTVTEILATEGQWVNRGQILLKLNDGNARMELDAMQLQVDALDIMQARLTAERDELPDFSPPNDVMTRWNANKTVSEIIDTQTKLFQNRKAAFHHQMDMNNRRIDQTTEQVNGQRSLLKAFSNRQKLIEEEANMVRKLVSSGNSSRLRMIDMEKSLLEAQGQIASLEAAIAQQTNVIAENQLANLKLRQERQESVNNELREVQRQLGENRVRLKYLAEVLDRTIVRAPVTGTVLGMTVFTIGAVINRGDRIMDIVPANTGLVVEAMIKTDDIDELRPGMEARVRLSALKSEGMPVIIGRITRISADRLVDSNTKVGAYPIEIRFSSDENPDWDKISDRLYPGMPTEIKITTRQRSALTYLVEPIIMKFDSAFIQR